MNDFIVIANIYFNKNVKLVQHFIQYSWKQLFAEKTKNCVKYPLKIFFDLFEWIFVADEIQYKQKVIQFQDFKTTLQATTKLKFDDINNMEFGDYYSKLEEWANITKELLVTSEILDFTQPLLWADFANLTDSAENGTADANYLKINSFHKELYEPTCCSNLLKLYEIYHSQGYTWANAMEISATGMDFLYQ